MADVHRCPRQSAPVWKSTLFAYISASGLPRHADECRLRSRRPSDPWRKSRSPASEPQASTVLACISRMRRGGGPFTATASYRSAPHGGGVGDGVQAHRPDAASALNCERKLACGDSPGRRVRLRFPCGTGVAEACVASRGKPRRWQINYQLAGAVPIKLENSARNCAAGLKYPSGCRLSLKKRFLAPGIWPPTGSIVSFSPR